jgi:hypothetical protein
MTRYLVFNESKLSPTKQFIRFATVAFIGFFANLGVLKVLIQSLDIYPPYARIGAALSLFVASYFVHKVFSFSLSLRQHQPMKLNSIISQVTEVAKEAGQFIRHERITFDTDKVEYKGLNDLVSYVDKTAEQKIVAGLEKIFPEAGFITEEKTTTKIGDTYNWIIDPLDGTTNFIHGLPVFR